MWCKVIPMNDSERPQEADVSGVSGKTCQWCQGTGYVSQALAYAPGVDPFRGPHETVQRAGECRHCRGSGTYDSHCDPTLERWRTQESRES
ncbi:hypothetical protein DC74_5714 [Streptomyces noursei]|uniref:Uncharacterized protein n=2 Tax=Streptomyces TaxID=1883 RepID=A0A059W3Y6_STRNR|nr:hypothetical protein DC74_5714 [Streptomyces noursei]GCB93829.1 hypothetical protein SALB_06620 [Streptomyces noursei]